PLAACSSAGRGERHRSPRGGHVEAELAGNAHRLQMDRSGSAADEHIGADTGAERRFGSRALVEASERAMVIAGSRRKHCPDQPAPRGEAQIDAELADGPDIALLAAIRALEQALDLLGRTQHIA